MIGSLFALVGPHDDEPVDLVAATVVLEVHRVVDVAYAPPRGRSGKRQSMSPLARDGLQITKKG